MIDHSSQIRPARIPGWLTIAGVAGVAFVIAASVSWIAPFAPRVHDEFSYLLAADTLLHGRLANPTPEVWQPFQSFHTLLAPAYVSKYPLGQGMVVATGWALFGLPIAGCWLAAALCAASITWMLGGVTSRRWAILGGLLVACHPAMQSTWSQTLLSGWLTAAGSALLAGGVFRLRRRYHPMAAAACGTGIAIMALTRPFEGLVATCISAAVLWGLWRGRSLKTKALSVLRNVPVAAIPIAAAFLLIGLQNYAISGKISGLPYRLHEQQYSAAPLFVFGHQQTPTMEATGQVPQIMLDFQHGWALESFLERPGVWGWLVGIGRACWTLWDFWELLAIVPVLSVGYWSGYRLTRLLSIAVAIQLLCSATVCWIFPHYLSPMLPWLMTLTVIGLRRIFRIFVKAQFVQRTRPQRFVATLLVAELALLLVIVVRLPSDPMRAWAAKRAAIAADMEKRTGDHLLLVHYSPEHNVHQEWVYNLADIESAKVLWARGERDDWNARLAERYARSRFIWQLSPDDENPRPQLLSAPRQ